VRRVLVEPVGEQGHVPGHPQVIRVPEFGAMDEGTLPRQSTWHRFLDGRTSGQRFLVALGALAGALLAIGGVIAGVGALVGDHPDPTRLTPGTSRAGEAVVTNQSEGADAFVRLLLATNGAPIQLNHKVLAPDAESHFRLEYDCAKRTGCSYTRLEAAQFIPDRIEGGVWYRGCFSVVGEGAGYAAQHLDLEFTLNGPTCPG
jgi:hypothetical protein